MGTIMYEMTPLTKQQTLMVFTVVTIIFVSCSLSELNTMTDIYCSYQHRSWQHFSQYLSPTTHMTAMVLQL